MSRGKDATLNDTWHELLLDNGCDQSPTCVTCPLPVCKYDLSHGSASIRRQQRLTAVVALSAAGHDAYTIAARLGIATRTAFRLIQVARERGGEQGLGGTSIAFYCAVHRTMEMP